MSTPYEWRARRRYADRREAGAVLAGHLREFAGRDVVVLGLPRGGIPVACERRNPLREALNRKRTIDYRPTTIRSSPQYVTVPSVVSRCSTYVSRSLSRRMRT